MARKADYNQGEKPRPRPSCLLARLIMVASWASALVLAWYTVLSPDIRWRFLGMLMAVLVVAPSLVLGFRQVTREVAVYEPRDKPIPDVQSLTQLQPPDDPKAGIYVDQATGMASRRYLTMFLQREINRCRRTQAPIALAIFDVDAYQKLEKRAGANALNTALADIGARLKSALREYDLVARYSPGRLALVLPETDTRGAQEVVQRLHALATSVRLNGAPLSVTVGISGFPEHGETPDELINSAHHALNQGRSNAANAVYVLDALRKAG